MVAKSLTRSFHTSLVLDCPIYDPFPFRVCFGIIVSGSREVPRVPIGPRLLTAIRDPFERIVIDLIHDYDGLIQMADLCTLPIKEVKIPKMALGRRDGSL